MTIRPFIKYNLLNQKLEDFIKGHLINGLIILILTQQRVALTYTLSVVDRATVFCFFEAHEIKFIVRWIPKI